MPASSDSPPIFSVLGLDHVVFRVSDVDRAISFYRDVLGCQVERTLNDLGLYQLRAGSALIDLVDVSGPLGQQGGQPPASTGHNVDHICLRIDPFDADALTAFFNRHGSLSGEVGRRYGADGYGPSVYVKDPDGNTVELKGPPDEQQ